MLNYFIRWSGNVSYLSKNLTPRNIINCAMYGKYSNATTILVESAMPLTNSNRIPGELLIVNEWTF